MGLMTVWNGGQLFGGEAKAKAFYKYHRYVPCPLLLHVTEETITG